MATVDQVIGSAKSAEGKPYVYGADSPTTGFDCSGLITYVFGLAGISLPHNAAAQQASSKVVRVSSPQPGDLVFFGSPAYHVGLYVGNGQMISAPHTGAVVHQTSVGSGATYGRVQGLGGTLTPGVLGGITTVADTASAAGVDVDKLMGEAQGTSITLAVAVLGLGLVGAGLWLTTKNQRAKFASNLGVGL